MWLYFVYIYVDWKYFSIYWPFLKVTSPVAVTLDSILLRQFFCLVQKTIMHTYCLCCPHFALKDEEVSIVTAEPKKCGHQYFFTLRVYSSAWRNGIWSLNFGHIFYTKIYGTFNFCMPEFWVEIQCRKPIQNTELEFQAWYFVSQFLHRR